MSDDIISLTDFKADASRWLKRLQKRPPVVLTQNGRGLAVVQSYDSYKQMRNALAMQAIVARGEADARAGRVTPHGKVFADLRRELGAGIQQQARSRKSPKRG